jgi:hypothetical protein
VRFAVCGVRCVAVWHSNSCSVLKFAAERTAVSGSAAVRDSVHGGMLLSGSARGSVRLSSGAAVCVESGSEHIFK